MSLNFRLAALVLGVGAFTLSVAPAQDSDTYLLLSPVQILENGAAATLRAQKWPPNPEVVTLEVSLSDTSLATLSGTTFTFPPGAVYANETLTVTVVDNDVEEDDARLTISGLVSEGSGVQSPRSVGLTIMDNDGEGPAEVVLRLTPERVIEGTVSFVTAESSKPLSEALQISVSASPTNPPHTLARDFALSDDTLLTIPAGQTRSTGTVTIAAVDDSVSDLSPRRYRQLRVAGALPADSGLDAPDDRILNILEDDFATQIIIVATPAVIPENGGVSTITLRALQPVPAEMTVTIADLATDLAGSAELSTERVLTIAAGETESSGTVTLTALDDTDESIETVWISASSFSRGVDIHGHARVVVLDDDESGEAALWLTPSPLRLYEGEVSTISATLTRPLANDVEVTLGVDTDNRNHTAEPESYTLSANRTLTIPAGSTSSDDTVTLTAMNDEFYGPVTFRRVVWEAVSVTGIDEFYVHRYGDWSILEDEPPTIATLIVAPAAIGEDGGQSVVTARLNTELRSDTEITVTAMPVGSAQDVDIVQTGTVLTIPAGATTSSGTVTITAADDKLYGPDKHFVVSGALGLGDPEIDLPYYIFYEGLTVTDDDTVPTAVTLSLSPSSVSEGAAGTAVTVTASLGGSALPAATEVLVSRTGGTATSGTDYPAIADFMVTIPAGQTSGTAELSFDPTEDSLAEGYETVVLTGSATGLTAGTATLTITDNDAAPTALTLSLNPTAVAEGAAATAVTVTASLADSALPTATQVTVSQTGGTATSGTDYSAIADFTVTIPAGQTSGSAQLSFDPTEDSVAEGDETVILTGSATGLTAGTATLTITDNDTESTAVTLSVDTASVEEDAGATTVTVTATLDEAAFPPADSTDVTVSVGAAGDGATEGTDYATVDDLTVTIPGGSTSGSATFTLTPTDDTVREGDETLSVTGAATGLTVTGTEVTISDNETASTGFYVEANPSEVDEDAGATQVAVTVRLNGAAFADATDVTVSVGAVDDAATEGTDYTSVDDFTVTVPGGSTTGTGTFTLTPIDDAVWGGGRNAHGDRYRGGPASGDRQHGHDQRKRT